MYPENSEGTRVIVGSMKMGYVYPTLPGMSHSMATDVTIRVDYSTFKRSTNVFNNNSEHPACLL